MNNTGNNIRYFMSWGCFYGVVLSTWSTTVMLPGFGSIFGVLWGLGIGAACGLLCGLIVSLIYPSTLNPDTDLVRAGRRLSLGIGVLVGIAAPALLMVTSRGILWGPYSGQESRFFVPSVMAALFWGSLSAAYVAYSYPFVLAHSLLGKQDSSPSQWTFIPFFNALMEKSISWLTAVVGGVLGIIWNMVRYSGSQRTREALNATDLLLQGLAGVMEGAVSASLFTVMLSLGAASFIMFLGRILFSEGALSHGQRIVLTASTALFSGVVLCWPVVNTNMNVSKWLWYMPVCGALLAGFYAYQVLPLVVAQDKAKRKEKNKLALSEEADAEEDLLIDEEPLIEAQQH